MSTSVRDQLIRAREKARMTQDQIALAVGWKRPSSVSHFERGVRDTQVEEAERWAAACGFEIVLVPTKTEDPEGLQALVEGIGDPFTRSVVADLIRLARLPGAVDALKAYRKEFEEMSRILRERAELKASLSR
jgi:transcriptional regulator with XRE-family HTH domain